MYVEERDKGKKKENMEQQKTELCHLLKSRYLVGEFLKEGEYSRIYRAYDAALDQEVILKEFIPADLNEEDRKRFVEEAGRFFGGYEYHGTAEVLDVFCEENRAYTAMEYLSGQNLRQYLHFRKKSQITIEEAWTLLLPVLEIVSWMHSIGIVHSGITMERLIFNEKGSLCLTGIGDCFLRSRKTEDAGPWSDVHSVADILYECLTGKKPAQAGRFLKKGKVRSISFWADVSNRVDRTIRYEMESEAGEGSFGIYALAEKLGMQGESLVVYFGATRSIWGEKWLDLTEQFQRQTAERDRTPGFMTRRQRKIIGIFLGIVLLTGGAAFGYVHTHGRQILEYQIQKDHKKYQKSPALLLVSEDETSEEIWTDAQKEGTLNEMSSSERTIYDVAPEFMEKRNLPGNNAQGFAIQDRHFKKLIEEVFEISLEEKSHSRECSVSKLGDHLPYLEICNQKDTTYVSDKKTEEENIEMISDGESGRVNSCKVVLSEEKMKIFLEKIFPQIVPETYFTESEIETVITLASQELYYDFAEHGKFRMTLQKESDPTEEKAPARYRLDLESYASEAEREKEIQAAGSYSRSSAEYQEFQDFVKKYAVKNEKEGLTTTYWLEETAVRKWNQPSNIKLFDKTRKDFMQFLKNQDTSFALITEKNLFQVKDSGIGAIETQFLKELLFEDQSGEKISVQYDIVSERIYKINLFSEGTRNNWDCGLAAALTLDFSEDCSKSRNALAEEIKKTLESLKGSSVQQQDYTDLSWMILMDSEGAAQFVLRKYGILGGREYMVSEKYWPQNGEN